MALSEKTTTVSGAVVHYWEAGNPNNRPIILLHGGFGNAFAQWSEVIPLLADEYWVVAPDLPGFGQSDALRDMRVSSLLEWLRGFFHMLEIDAAVVIGNSFGGLLGRLLAANTPALVPALILVNGGVIPTITPLTKLLGRLPVLGHLLFDRIANSISRKSNLEDVLEVTTILTPEFMRQVDANRKALSRLMQGMTVSAMPNAQNPAVPVLVLWGDADTIAPPRVGEYVKRSIPGAVLSPVAGCGHLPHVEAPDVFASQVSLFLMQLDRGRRGAGAGILSPLK